MLEEVQILANWEDYATIKKWKNGLKYNSHRNRLSPSTLEAIRNWMPLYIKYTRKTPDDLIEEALNGKETVKARLSDFCTWLHEEKGKKFNAAVHAAYHIIRGFYSHNDINTQKIRTPKVDPSEVQLTDDQVPLFDIVEVENADGTKRKEKVLKRALIKNFFECLPTRDKIIAMCIKDSGMDSGDILDLPLSTIRYQDQSQERIFIRGRRNKTGEIVSTFFSTETSQFIRNYVRLHRANATDEESIFVESSKESKINFHKKHGKPFNRENDELKLGPVDPHNLSKSFRIATKKLEKLLSTDEKPVKLLQNVKQSPLRPKRFRKLFSDVCDDVGIPVDVKRVFMGKSDPSNKPYEGKSRQDLEIYYEKIEPKLMIYSEPPRDYSKDIKILKEQLKEELRKEFSFFVEGFKSKSEGN
jgi:hypothetical protein